MNHIEHIEIYVANLPLAVHFYKSIFQFVPMAFLNQTDRMSILLQHDRIRLILTASAHPNTEVSDFIRVHGDGVKKYCFQCEKCNGAV